MKDTIYEAYVLNDDGTIPNSHFPIIIYHDVAKDGENGNAQFYENIFAENGWKNSWRNGVYNYHHYHSVTHEVLAVYNGEATLHMGGPNGRLVKVRKGHVLLIPAGVGHKCTHHSDDFAVVGAYPEGSDYNLLLGKKEERPQADKEIAQVPIPPKDPVFGAEGAMLKLWINTL